MTLRAVHQNLDTAFVDLSALVEHLRAKRFAGLIRVRFPAYEAEIRLTVTGAVNVRDLDRVSGRAASGRDALSNILQRSREKGGAIGVFQFAEEISGLKTAGGKTAGEDLPERSSAPPKAGRTAGNESEKPNTETSRFPFPPPGGIRSKVRPAAITAERYRVLALLLAEILRAVDAPLAAARLNFPAALKNACAEIGGDYPFLEPEKNIFRYEPGGIVIKGRTDAYQLAGGLLEAVRRVLRRLAAKPAYSDAHRAAVQNLSALVRRRKALCDEFYLTAKIEKIVGL